MKTGTTIGLFAAGGAAIGGLAYLIWKKKQEETAAATSVFVSIPSSRMAPHGPVLTAAPFVDIDPVATALALARKLKSTAGAASLPTSPAIPGNPRPFLSGKDGQFSSEKFLSKIEVSQKWQGVWVASWLVWAAEVQGRILDYEFSDPIPGKPGAFKSGDRIKKSPSGWESFYAKWHSAWEDMGAHEFETRIYSFTHHTNALGLSQTVANTGVLVWDPTTLPHFLALKKLPDIRPIIMGLLPSDPWNWEPKPSRIRYSQYAGVPDLPILDLAKMGASARKWAEYWYSSGRYYSIYSGEDLGPKSEDTGVEFAEHFSLCVLAMVVMLIGSKWPVAGYAINLTGLTDWLGGFWSGGGMGLDLTTLGSVFDSAIENLGHAISVGSGADWPEELADWVGDVVEIIINSMM